MFESFEELCNYYDGCVNCPYENCASREDCEKQYNIDSETMVNRLDMLIEFASTNSKLDELNKKLDDALKLMMQIYIK